MNFLRGNQARSAQDQKEREEEEQKVSITSR